MRGWKCLLRNRRQIDDEGKRVWVGRSAFHNTGVFANAAYPADSLLCFFVGTPDADTSSELAQRYMVCSQDGVCCVPTTKDGARLLDVRADDAGHLCNEASAMPTVRGEMHFSPNARIVPTAKDRCRDGLRRWEIRTTRPVQPAEEILICYGRAYGFRKGYTCSDLCD